MGTQTINKTNFHFPGQTGFAKGSVRDIYTINDKYLAMVVTDRISAFDVLLPVAIPNKGQVLSQLATYFLDATKDIIPNWLISSPDPNVVLGYKCQPYKIEVVIRGYLCGHAWREYKSGKRELCGVKMSEGLKENDKFPEPIITPATHAEQGHDEDISAKDIVKRGLIPADDWVKIEKYTRKLYQRGSKMAAKRGLILVDTKYEFGRKNSRLVLMDEIHTPDSSRYFYEEGYVDKQKRGEPQHQLSKEFVREWLIEHDFQGLKGQTMPAIPATFVQEISERYIELYEQLTGKKLKKPLPSENILERIELNLNTALSRL
ncbi:MAG TPA: phosphoribosylaminoimidazolesuccinocarboxamide synthase [Patescibacteria group bacterium]|nr:phosphoribosylaminoimidazolesuccinocarboxamide synthase [Patescibacteria group bacterium]